MSDTLLSEAEILWAVKMRTPGYLAHYHFVSGYDGWTKLFGTEAQAQEFCETEGPRYRFPLVPTRVKVIVKEQPEEDAGDG